MGGAGAFWDPVADDGVAATMYELRALEAAERSRGAGVDDTAHISALLRLADQMKGLCIRGDGDEDEVAPLPPPTLDTRITAIANRLQEVGAALADAFAELNLRAAARPDGAAAAALQHYRRAAPGLPALRAPVPRCALPRGPVPRLEQTTAPKRLCARSGC